MTTLTIQKDHLKYLVVLVAVIAIVGVFFYMQSVQEDIQASIEAAAQSQPPPEPTEFPIIDLNNVKYNPSAEFGEVGSTHTHNGFAMIVNNQQMDFSNQFFQLRAPEVHFEDGEGDILHTHATGITLGHALATMEFEITDECITFQGQAICNQADRTLRLIQNGALVPRDYASYELQDGNVLLISFGTYQEAKQQWDVFFSSVIEDERVN